MPDYLVQEEDGTSRFTLEDGTGSLLFDVDSFPPSRVSQLPIEVVESGVSNARFSQVAIEVVLGAAVSAARVTQEPVEVVVAGESVARISQVPVEVVLGAAASFARISQVPVEVVVAGPSDAAITQVAFEMVVQNTYETVNVLLIHWIVGDPDPEP